MQCGKISENLQKNHTVIKKNNGRQLKILSKVGELCRIELKQDMKISSSGKNVSFKKLPDGIVEFKTVKGAVYLIN